MAVDEQAFLKTIHDRPREPGPRLVFSDWLEERGETAWSELFRQRAESGDAKFEEMVIRSDMLPRVAAIIAGATKVLFRWCLIEAGPSPLRCDEGCELEFNHSSVLEPSAAVADAERPLTLPASFRSNLTFVTGRSHDIRFTLRDAAGDAAEGVMVGSRS